jgi:hypothetical protein
MFRALPPVAVMLGIAGLIPFVFQGIGAVGASPERSLAAVHGLIGYGAVILAFLGGVHWGFTLGEEGDAKAVRARLGLGVLPALVGWLAILAGIVAAPPISLTILIAGFLGTVFVETRAQQRDLMPSGYLALRWALSFIVVVILSAVLGARLIGAHVLL